MVKLYSSINNLDFIKGITKKYEQDKSLRLSVIVPGCSFHNTTALRSLFLSKNCTPEIQEPRACENLL